MISYYSQIVILSIVQGISEFIPVSSSAHLLVMSNLSNFNFSSLEIDVSLHLGSLIAILIYFRKELIAIFKNKKLLYLIIFGSIPLIIIGYVFHSLGIVYLFRNIKVIAWTTLIFGILLYVSDKKDTTKKFEDNLNTKNIILIGLFQAIAIIPGVSRSGIVITAGRLLNFSRIDSAKIEFILSIPALTGASFLVLSNVIDENIKFNLIIFISIFFSCIFSYLTIKFLLFYLKKFSLKVFVYYRIILAVILFLISYS